MEVKLAMTDEEGACSAAGWGKLCIEPHNFLILGKLWEDDVVVLVSEGGGFAENAATASADIRFGFCCSRAVLLVSSPAFSVAPESLLLLSVFAATGVEEVLSEFPATN